MAAGHAAQQRWADLNEGAGAASAQLAHELLAALVAVLAGPQLVLALALGVRGVGAWTFDKLDYANATQRDAMWAAFDRFLLGPGP